MLKIAVAVITKHLEHTELPIGIQQLSGQKTETMLSLESRRGGVYLQT